MTRRVRRLTARLRGRLTATTRRGRRADARSGRTRRRRPAEGSDPVTGADRRRRGAATLARIGHLEYDRVLFFSDAIFAIAITLLALDLRVPIGRSFQAGHELRLALPGIESFTISFVVIGLFWTGHHSLFRHIIAIDRPCCCSTCSSWAPSRSCPSRPKCSA